MRRSAGAEPGRARRRGRGQRVGAEGMGIMAEGGAIVGQRGGGAIGRTREPFRRQDPSEWAWPKGLGRLRELRGETRMLYKKGRGQPENFSGVGLREGGWAPSSHLGCGQAGTWSLGGA